MYYFSMKLSSKEIIKNTDQLAPSFYDEQDRAQGFMLAKNRKGETEKFNFLAIGIGIVHNTKRKLSSFAQVSHIGAELKCLAKQHPQGSYYVLDRRTE